MKFSTRFKWLGGVHPKDHKQLTAERAIRRLPLPERLFVSLQQHVGAPAAPRVVVGERVSKGQLIAAAQGRISAPVHAPTSGRVIAIGDYTAPHPSGLPVASIVIETDGDDRWLEADPPADPFALGPGAIAEGVSAAGIVGLGGAAFPSAVKLNLSRKSGIRTLIINGGECEPYLTCDDRLMRERAPEVVAGILLIQQAVAAREVFVGIERNKPEAIAAMKQAVAGTGIRVSVVPSSYPMGWDKQLTRVIIGQEVPAGGRSADIGLLVHNVATAYAVWQAIALGRPLVSRIITVSGGAVATPNNLEVPIGAPVAALFQACGGFCAPPAKYILGGPMMGEQIRDLQVPIVKVTSGVLALTAAETGMADPAPCIRCTTCVRACPVGLLPLEMVARIRNSDFKAAAELGLEDCIACGSCAYVCPAHIPLVHYFNHAKGELAAKERHKLKLEGTKRLAAERLARLERIAREREEAARARAAKKTAANDGHPSRLARSP